MFACGCHAAHAVGPRCHVHELAILAVNIAEDMIDEAAEVDTARGREFCAGCGGGGLWFDAAGSGGA